MYTWRTDDDGRIRVTENDVEWLPYPSQVTASFIDSGVARFGDMFRAEANAVGIDWAWLVAMAWQESRFDPRAKSKDGGCGLFQITHPSLKGPYSYEQLCEPQLNTRIAARFIGDLKHRFGPDFVRISAAFNAGSPRQDPSNKWNLHCTPGHIDSEVKALNYVLSRGLPLVEAEPIDLVAEAEPEQDPKE
jgi:hypothetical protein